MRTKNFPEKRNLRRIQARKETGARLEFWERLYKKPQDSDWVYLFSPQEIEARLNAARKEFEVLNSRIVSSMRNSRSKKHGIRGGKNIALV